jgi:hypothetical protein
MDSRIAAIKKRTPDFFCSTNIQSRSPWEYLAWEQDSTSPMGWAPFTLHNPVSSYTLRTIQFVFLRRSRLSYSVSGPFGSACWSVLSMLVMSMTSITRWAPIALSQLDAYNALKWIVHGHKAKCILKLTVIYLFYLCMIIMRLDSQVS